MKHISFSFKEEGMASEWNTDFSRRQKGRAREKKKGKMGRMN
jgi:hypothetical protein